jgi:hypothetical protein
MLVVAACVEALSQRDDALPDANIKSMHGLSSPVTVHQRRWTLTQKRVSQTSLVPPGQTHQFRRLAGGQPPFRYRC